MLSSQSCFEILQALQGKSSQVVYSVSSKHRVCTLQFTEFFQFNIVQQSVLWVNRDSNYRITQCKRTPGPLDKSVAGLFLKGLLIKSFQGEKKKEFIFSQNLDSPYISLGIGCQESSIHFWCKYSLHFLAQMNLIVHRKKKKFQQH